ncbi:MAG: hypothetical protein POH28_00560 [Acidocella sp.]|nr:hypothetical protein [Acidocella sp.]
MVKLISYLKESKQTYAQFGVQIGRSASDICRFALGKRVPSLEIALAIEKATGGIVTPAELLYLSEGD